MPFRCPEIPHHPPHYLRKRCSGVPYNGRAGETDALYNGWADAVAERATKYVTQQTWWRIRSGWPRRRCDRLARLALRILEVKNQLHEATGSAAAPLTKLLGRSKIEGVFAAELAERIPQP
jgi:hypothetical protein